MLDILKNRTFRHLFAAQVIALLGTGLATVALSLLAYDLAGAQAGFVLGTALAIKMIAYVGVSPFAGAVAEKLPRRGFLVSLDIVRGIIVLMLAFVDQVWQVYVLIFLLQSASASFTPAFQATIPDILPDEAEYTRALSLSRLAYDLENLLSPALAAALLALISFHWLFATTAVGFALSAVLVLSVALPAVTATAQMSFFERATKGIRNYLKTPRLRGLLALNLAAAAGGAMVIVNTVVYVRSVFGLGESAVAIALAVFGGGSMIAALALPRLLERVSDRPVMLSGGAGLVAGLLALCLAPIGASAGWWSFLALWFVLGLAYSGVLTPAGRLLRRSAHKEDRPALFAAQFALSHACWLITYPMAGWLGGALGLSVTAGVLAVLAGAGAALAVLAWPRSDPEVLLHVHDDLPADHPHVQGARATARGLEHAHAYVIDEHHARWPRPSSG
ncbi:MAG: MFS transporter [Alphaproteobacteria bacterium]|jgi:MFS family permease|nr:MFS transporter [Alphaproteobacteria bacterium]